MYIFIYKWKRQNIIYSHVSELVQSNLGCEAVQQPNYLNKDYVSRIDKLWSQAHVLMVHVLQHPELPVRPLSVDSRLERSGDLLDGNPQEPPVSTPSGGVIR